MKRLIAAFHNSVRAFQRLVRSEAAFQQEFILFLLSLPAAWFLAPDWIGYLILVGSIVVLMIVEVLNTGIEGACNAVTRDFSDDIQFAKDCGSLAVLLTCFLVGAVWLTALYHALA